MQIRHALGVSIEELLKDTDLEQKLIIKKNERINEYTYNEKASASIVNSPNSDFLMLELDLEYKGKTIAEKAVNDGRKIQKWIYVIQGTLNCFIDEEEHVLKSKDTLTFNSTIPHYFYNKYKKKCICLIGQFPKK